MLAHLLSAGTLANHVQKDFEEPRLLILTGLALLGLGAPPALLSD